MYHVYMTASEVRLPPLTQKIWELRTEGQSVPAIAKLVDQPERRVRWLLQQAMARLDKSDPLGRLSRIDRKTAV